MAIGGINMGTLFKIPTLGACTTSLSSAWTTSACTLDEEPTLECAISSIALSTTTASMTSFSDKSVTINISQHYIESLSEEQLAELSEKIEAKEKNFVVETNANNKDVVVKVKTKDSKKI